MEFKAALSTLRQSAKLGSYVFDGSDFQVMMPKDSKRSVVATVSRLQDAGILKRASKGIYVYEEGKPKGSDILLEIAKIIRRGTHSYVSLEQALSAYGVISQIPMCMTMMSTGREGEFKTPWGTIEFTHTERTPLEIYKGSVVQPNSSVRMALPKMALEDLKRVRRNLHLVNMDDYKEALEDTGRHKL